MSDTPQSLWIQEFRSRKRKNGKWSEWLSTQPGNLIVITAYTVAPPESCDDTYERRPVEYIRKPEEPTK
jgi:hypothetical protein